MVALCERATDGELVHVVDGGSGYHARAVATIAIEQQ